MKVTSFYVFLSVNKLFRTLPTLPTFQSPAFSREWLVTLTFLMIFLLSPTLVLHFLNSIPWGMLHGDSVMLGLFMSVILYILHWQRRAELVSGAMRLKEVGWQGNSDQILLLLLGAYDKNHLYSNWPTILIGSKNCRINTFLNVDKITKCITFFHKINFYYAPPSSPQGARSCPDRGNAGGALVFLSKLLQLLQLF